MVKNKDMEYIKRINRIIKVIFKMTYIKVKVYYTINKVNMMGNLIMAKKMEKANKKIKTKIFLKEILLKMKKMEKGF